MSALLRACLAALALLAALAGCSGQGPTITRLEEAAEARIGVMTGSTGEAIVARRFPAAEVKSFDDIMDAVAALKSGQLDAFVVGYPTALQVGKKNRDLMVLAEKLDEEDTAVAARKQDTELLAQVNRILGELEADGTLADMGRRWLKDELLPYEELDIALPTEGQALRVGVAATREPFSFVDKTGRVTGHDGELARLLAARLNRPVEFLNMKFMALIPALQSGKIDLIVTGMTATPERAKYVAFSRPYFANAQVMTVRRPEGAAGAGEFTREGARALASLEDLREGRLGVLMGSAQESFATRSYPGAQVLQYKTFADLLLAVKTGKVDAGLYDEEPLRTAMREQSGFALLDGALFSFPVGAGFGKDAAELRERFDRFVQGLREQGVYGQAVRRWVELGDTTMPQVAAAGQGEPLVVGVSDIGLPFIAVKDNRLVGLDIELAERFAAHLGRPLELQNMDFGSLVAAVASGKVDMVLSSIFITEERRQRIEFSEPYYEVATRALVLAERARSAAVPVPAAPAEPSFLQRLSDSFVSNIVRENRYLLIWQGLKTTVLISVLSTLAGTLLGALVCYMRMSERRLLNLPARGYIGLVRGMPVLVLLMLLFYVAFASVDINPVAVAVIAFGMNFAAYVSEMFRSGIEGVDPGQTEAGLTLGFSRVMTFVLIVLPQALQRILPVYKGEFISLVKMTSVVGYIAVQDLTKASDIIRSRTFDAFFPLVMVAVLYFLIAWVLIQSLGHLERATDPKRRKRRGGRT